jgi:hopanoid biosynthesis associated RND transporter like protein HpnN
MVKFGQSILRSCANLAAQHPWWILIATVVLTVLASLAAARLSVDTSTEDILSAELRFRQIEIDYDREFPQEDLVVAVIDAPNSNEADIAARELIEGVEARPQSFERIEAAGNSPYFIRNGLLFLPPEEIAEIGEQIRQARRVLTAIARDPTLRGMAGLMGMIRSGVEESAAPPSTARLLSMLGQTVDGLAANKTVEMPWSDLFAVDIGDRGTRRLVEMKPVLDDNSLDRAGRALEDLDVAIAELVEKHPDVKVRVTGEPVLRQQELNDAFSGALYASSLSFVLVALSLIIGIRSGRLIIALLLALVVGSVWTAGLAAVTIGRLNLISVAFLVLFFGLGVDFGTHLGLRHLEEAKQGKSFKDALLAAMLGEGPSIVLSALCAALAFLAFVPTSYTGLAEFGIISALGMLVAVVVTFTVQPALMALMPPRPKPSQGVTIGIGGFIARNHRIVLVLAAIATAVSLYYSLGVQIDTNPLNLQNPNTESVQTYRDLAGDPDTSPYALNVIAPDADTARELSPKLAARPGVVGVRWIEDFVPQDQEAKLAAIAAARERLGEAFFSQEKTPAPSDAELTDAFAKIKADVAAIAATPETNPIDPSIIVAGKMLADSLAGFEKARGTEPQTLKVLGDAMTRELPPILTDLQAKFSVSEPVSIADIPDDLREEWIAKDGRVRMRVLPDGDIGTPEAMREFTESVQAVTPEVAGAPASVTGAGEAILHAFAEAILYTIIAIGLVVALQRRKLADVILVLAPLGVAALWTVAAAAVLDLPFNFANIIVIPLLIGLGVASSIHIVVRTHEVVSDSTGVHEEGMHVLDTSTPLAVLVAQLNTVAAFATLAVAEHRGLFSMGVLLGIAILFVLIVSLIVLPSFMIAIGVGAKAPTQPTSQGGTR